MLISQVMHFVDPSREVLAETLLAAGPDAATLCTGWRTQELAAHLFLRERNAGVGLGLILRAFARASDASTRKLAAKSSTADAYARLVEQFRSGPPALSPMRIKAVDESSNLIEYFVHTEDVRRATDRWAPRALDEEYSDALWSELVKRAAILYRGVDLGIVLVQPSGPRHVAKRAPVSVAIVGEPGELLMHAHGRTEHALVTFEGQPDAVALLQTAEVGL
ncbi:TIGR03085 family metal-binding protein [Arthrobacter russicus]